MSTRRAIILGIASVGLAACAGPAPTVSALDQASRSNINIVGVNVVVDRMGPSTSGRAVSSDRVKQLVQSYAQANLVNQGAGARKVVATIDIESVNVINATQSALVGGESVMSGTVSLADAGTGEVVLAPKKVQSGGGGWVVGGLVAVATRDDADTEVAQMSKELVARSKIIVFGQEE